MHFAVSTGPLSSTPTVRSKAKIEFTSSQGVGTDFSRPATVRDLARHAGVSRTTVSRVLTGSPNVSEDARRRVLEAIEDLNYRVNQAARSLRTMRSALVGFMIPTMGNEIMADIVERVDARLRELEIGLVIGSSGDDPRGDRLVFESLESRGVDAVIVASSSDRDSNLAALLSSSQTPLVLLDREFKGVNAAAVLTAHSQGLSEAMTELGGFGHQTIGLVCPTLNSRPGRALASAFRESAESLNLDSREELVVSLDHPSSPAAKLAVDFLLSMGVTALIVAGPVALLAAVIHTLDERGLTVPGHISLVAYTDATAASLVKPQLSIISRSIVDEGAALSTLLLAQLGNRSAPPRVQIMPTGYVAGASVGPRPS
jgi:LacI family transcriptional regulator